jgi:predicted amidophosphoribosyltransferase
LLLYIGVHPPRRLPRHADQLPNLKKKPTDVACNPFERTHKLRAILHCALALRRLTESCRLKSQVTWVPIPPSKATGHPDHDDRLQQILMLALGDTFDSANPLLQQTQSTAADHHSADRRRFDELLKITRINETFAKATKPVLVIIDDVLNTGKHFKVAQTLLTERFPTATIHGLFLARCLSMHYVKQ